MIRLHQWQMRSCTVFVNMSYSQGWPEPVWLAPSPLTSPAFLTRLSQILTEVAAHIHKMSGPARKRIGDAMAIQTRVLAAALEISIEIPERDLVVLNRP